MYVLLEYYNDYNQYGGYFIGIYTNKEKALERTGLKEFGRKEGDDSWYELEYLGINDYDKQL